MIESLVVNIWGKEFTLPVEYDCYAGETITAEQKRAIETFACHSEWIAEARTSVERYCEDQVASDTENEKKDNIFYYMKPEYLFVKRDEQNARILLMCRYRYDPEHGLAVVFAADGNVTVGPQDIIL